MNKCVIRHVKVLRKNLFGAGCEQTGWPGCGSITTCDPVRTVLKGMCLDRLSRLPHNHKLTTTKKKNKVKLLVDSVVQFKHAE